MPQYMAQFSYTGQAWAALAQHPADRTEVIGGLAAKLGCRLLNLHYTMGEYDGLVILEAPDDIAVMAFIIAAHAPGHIKASKTTRLYSSAEAVDAMRKAGGATFQGPG